MKVYDKGSSGDSDVDRKIRALEIKNQFKRKSMPAFGDDPVCLDFYG